MRFGEAIWELDQIMTEEADYRFELSNTRRMRRNLRKHKIYVPKPFPEYCTKGVLVTEYVTGVLMSHYIKASDTEPDLVAAWEVENNVDPERVGRRLYLSFMRQLFEENLFHGDLHPGNIILLRDSRLALIDFGTIGTVERNLWRKYLFMIKAIAKGELDKAADLVLALSPKFPVVDIEEVKQDMIRVLRAWSLRTPLKNMPYYEKSLTEVVTELTKVMTSRKIMVTWGFMKIDRTWGTMDASMNYLTPQVDYPRLFRRYFRERQRRLLRKLPRLQTLRSVVTEIPETISEYTLFLDPQLRAASRIFQGSSSKVADALSMLFGALSSGLLIIGAGVAAVFLHQHHGLFEKIGYEKGDIV
ncbi:MAG: AarF/ABC1/UbiB kinase family protein, partial [Candidatus Latescibacteria bacterium]|nr:AarF/ABC1/UbiB kinase family protein [Candidatus Latescibacterota bacterium]